MIISGQRTHAFIQEGERFQTIRKCNKETPPRTVINKASIHQHELFRRLPPKGWSIRVPHPVYQHELFRRQHPKVG